MSDQIEDQVENTQTDGELSDNELDQVAGGAAPAPGTQKVLIGLLLPAVQPQLAGDGSVMPGELNFHK